MHLMRVLGFLGAYFLCFFNFLCVEYTSALIKCNVYWIYLYILGLYYTCSISRYYKALVIFLLFLKNIYVLHPCLTLSYQYREHFSNLFICIYKMKPNRHLGVTVLVFIYSHMSSFNYSFSFLFLFCRCYPLVNALIRNFGNLAN